MNINPLQDVKVKIKMLKSETVLAQAILILFDVWEEKGWKILKSKEENPLFGDFVWIQSPCYRNGPKWTEIVYIDDRRLYEEVQKRIYDAYFIEKSKTISSGSETDEDLIIPDEI